MKILSLLLALLVIPSISGAESKDPAQSAEIRRLLELTGPRDLKAQISALVATQLNTRIKELGREVPPRVFEIVDEVVASEFEQADRGPNNLDDRLAELYERTFTADEIRELVTFYESPVGRRWLEASPAMMGEIRVVAQHWMEEVLPRIRERVEKQIADEKLLGEE